MNPELCVYIPPERFACTILPDTQFVIGRDGLLYCDECFEVLWPGEQAIKVDVPMENRARVWESYGYDFV